MLMENEAVKKKKRRGAPEVSGETEIATVEDIRKT